MQIKKVGVTSITKCVHGQVWAILVYPLQEQGRRGIILVGTIEKVAENEKGLSCLSNIVS